MVGCHMLKHCGCRYVRACSLLNNLTSANPFLCQSYFMEIVGLSQVEVNLATLGFGGYYQT